ncbi:MAG: flippase-like domain-containing protein [Muribaculaceae bacterium]|nr:flippase-like domain-containing protein [Muribaculaceae bacterium]
MAYRLRSTLLKAVIPAVIGVAVVVWMFLSDFNPQAWNLLRLDTRTVIGLCAALVFVVGRDWGLAWRFRIITDKALTWKRAFRVDIMCAFTSAITPSAVGGSALAVFYLNREGVKVGRATALTLTTLLLDELFFVVFCPVLILLIPWDDLFGEVSGDAFLSGMEWVFWLVYAGIVIWAGILYLGILARPQWLEKGVMWLFGLRMLRRWSKNAQEMMSNLRETSQWVRGRSKGWWAEVFGATTVSWFSRYFVVNALFWAFVPAASGLLVFGRQFVVWVVLMISPTPGGSGVSEYIFTNYYGDLIGDISVALVLATIWRILSYYIYLIGGALLAPSYFRKHEISD